MLIQPNLRHGQIKIKKRKSIKRRVTKKFAALEKTFLDSKKI
jgi:hypothetical protein